MDYKEYKELREKIGSQALVAELLDISIMTLSRRELGKIRLGKEAKLAILSLSGDGRNLLPSEAKGPQIKNPVKKEPENIKKSHPVKKPVPYTEDEDDPFAEFYEPAKKEHLYGVLVFGKEMLLGIVANQSHIPEDEIESGWKKGKTPYQVLECADKNAKWLTM